MLRLLIAVEFQEFREKWQDKGEGDLDGKQ